jgi:hypothetical protein
LRLETRAKMNKKQKLLTIVALITFVAIGACHYLAFESYPDYSAGKNKRVGSGDEVLKEMERPGTGRLQTVPVPDYREKLAWVKPKNAMLPDVITPWFMLGVIYTGLFFLLQNKRGS